MDTLNSVTAYLSALIANRPALAIVIGLIVSLAFTQWVKFVLLHTAWLPDPNGRYSLYCAVIVKRVDAQTRAKVGINELLRGTD